MSFDPNEIVGIILLSICVFFSQIFLMSFRSLKKVSKRDTRIGLCMICCVVFLCSYWSAGFFEFKNDYLGYIMGDILFCVSVACGLFFD